MEKTQVAFTMRSIKGLTQSMLDDAIQGLLSAPTRRRYKVTLVKLDALPVLSVYYFLVGAKGEECTITIKSPKAKSIQSVADLILICSCPESVRLPRERICHHEYMALEWILNNHTQDVSTGIVCPTLVPTKSLVPTTTKTSQVDAVANDVLIPRIRKYNKRVKKVVSSEPIEASCSPTSELSLERDRVRVHLERLGKEQVFAQLMSKLDNDQVDAIALSSLARLFPLGEEECKRRGRGRKKSNPCEQSKESSNLLNIAMEGPVQTQLEPPRPRQCKRCQVQEDDESSSLCVVPHPVEQVYRRKSGSSGELECRRCWKKWTQKGDYTHELITSEAGACFEGPHEWE